MTRWATLLVACIGATAILSPPSGAALPRSVQQVVDASLRGVDRDADIQVSARVETLDGEVVVDFDGETPRVLASNTKLLTTAAVLLEFAPERRWTTRCVLDGETLWVVGDGDPSLRRTVEGDHAEAFLDALSDALREAQCKELATVVLDARAFPGAVRPPGWPDNQWQESYCAPVAALQVEGSQLHVSLRNGRPSVHPPLGGRLRIDRGDRDGGTFAVWWRRADEELTVRGAKSGPEPAAVAVRDPLWLYATWLEEGLERRGIDVAKVRRAEGEESVPEQEPVYVHESAWTLAEAVAVVNKDSDNQLAETLLCTLGLAVEGTGTREAGLRAVRTVLTGADLDLTGMVQADGSGMSRGEGQQNLASPRLLCTLLREMVARPEGRVLFQSLPAAGQDGRLAGRFRDAVFRDGQVRAKTGFITGASSLSGYLLAPDGEIMVFSIVVNFVRDGKPRTNNRRFKRMQEEFLADVLRSRAR